MLTIFRAKALCVGLLLVIICAATQPVAQAKKKGDDQAAQAAAAAEQLAKEEKALAASMAPVNKTLDDLMRKYESRLLFTPQDASKLTDVKYKLIDLIDKNSGAAILTRPIYQAGFILAERGSYDDAFELLSFLSSQHGQTPYGLKAKTKLRQMEKVLGADYFQSIQSLNPQAGSGEKGEADVSASGGKETGKAANAKK